MQNKKQSSDIQPVAEKKRDQPSRVMPVCIGLIWVTLTGVLVFGKIQQQLYGLPVEGKVVEVGKPVTTSSPKSGKKIYTPVWIEYSIKVQKYKRCFEFKGITNVRVASPVSLLYFAENPGDAWLRESILPLIASAIAMLFGAVFLFSIMKPGSGPQ